MFSWIRSQNRMTLRLYSKSTFNADSYVCSYTNAIRIATFFWFLNRLLDIWKPRENEQEIGRCSDKKKKLTYDFSLLLIKYLWKSKKLSCFTLPVKTVKRMNLNYWIRQLQSRWLFHLNREGKLLQMWFIRLITRYLNLISKETFLEKKKKKLKYIFVLTSIVNKLT